MRGRAAKDRGGGGHAPSFSSPRLASPASPLSTTTTSPTPQTPPPSSPLKQDPSTPVLTTPEPPSLTAAPTDLFTPPPIALASPSAPEAADECAEPVLCTLTAYGPPPPPPWPESYVFSDDPDRIVCRNAAIGTTIFDGTTTVLCATPGNNSLYPQCMNVMCK
jgi:hypothetical protein